MKKQLRWRILPVLAALLTLAVLAASIGFQPEPVYAGKPRPTNTPRPTKTATLAPTATPTSLPPTPTPTSGPCAPTYQPGNLEVHVLNVGQAEAVLVVSPAGRSALFDVGDLPTDAHVVDYVYKTLCKKSVDYVVITHYHADHFGAFVDLLSDRGLAVNVATYDRGGGSTEYSSPQYTNYYNYCTTTNPAACKRTTLKEDSLLDLGAGMTAKVICAGDVVTHQSCGVPVSNENDYSIWTLITAGSMDVSLGGDTGGDTSGSYYADTETSAVNLGRIGAAVDEYVVHHHGSCYSTNQNLVNATRPTFSVFSLGNNTYGHPCSTVVNRLTTAGSRLYYTENSSGAVVDGDVAVIYAGGNTYTVRGAKGTTTFNTK